MFSGFIAIGSILVASFAGGSGVLLAGRISADSLTASLSAAPRQIPNRPEAPSGRSRSSAGAGVGAQGSSMLAQIP